MKLGCNSVVFASADRRTALEHIAAAGFGFVELAAIKGMCEHLDPEGNAEHLAGVQADLEQLELVPTAIEAATTDRQRLVKVFEVANALGIRIVNIGSGGTAGDEESTKQAIAHIADLAAEAKRHRVTLAVKPHVGQAIFDAATALRLTAQVPDDALGLNFDPSHLFRADEDPALVAQSWGARIVTVHFRDCASRERAVGPPETQVPGRGSVPLPGVLRALYDAGHTGPLNLEVIGTKNYQLSRAMGIAAESKGYLARCLQELGITPGD